MNPLDILNAVTNSQVWIHIGLFLFALVLIGTGFFILVSGEE